jgi:hypothetical protein
VSNTSFERAEQNYKKKIEIQWGLFRQQDQGMSSLAFKRAEQNFKKKQNKKKNPTVYETTTINHEKSAAECRRYASQWGDSDNRFCYECCSQRTE